MTAPISASSSPSSLPPTTVARAAVWRGAGGVQIEDVPVPSLAPGEALVRVRLATICGSDRHTVEGRRPAPCPSILGHEAIGEIEALGDGPVSAIDGAPVLRGQRVIWSVTAGCGRCDRCRAGLSAKCRTVRKAGHEAFDSAWPLSGSYATHVVLPAAMAIAAVPDALPDAVAAPAACATATVMAVVERAGMLDGRRVLIVGAGMLGLNAAAAVANRAAATVVVADPDAGRRALAADFGATGTVTSVAEAGEVDVVLEFSGVTEAVDAALRQLDVAGIAVLAGSVTPAAPVALDAQSVVRRYLTITGVHNYEPRHLVQAVELLHHTLPLRAWDGLVAAPVSLAELPRLLAGRPGPLPRYSVAP